MIYDSFSSPERGLDKNLWAPFFRAAPTIPYKKGQMIYMQGQEPSCFYCLLSGQVRTVMASPSGDERLLTTYRSGSIFGEASFFDGLPRVSTAYAQTDCKIIPINREQVNELFQQHPELATAMITYLARTVRLLSGHVDNMSFLQADRRIARILLDYPASDGVIHITHEALATAAGTSRVTVSRTLSRFSKEGWLTTGYGSIEILDRAALSALSES